MYKKIGQLLLEAEIITEEDIQKVLDYQDEGKDLKFGEILVLWNIINRETLDEYLGIQEKTA